MQDHPGAPGTARKRITRTVVPAACGGAAAHQKAPGQDRPPVAQPATRPDRPCATPQAPGYDVPQASPAWAPVHNRPSAAPRAPVADRCRPAQRAPGQDRPLVAQNAAGPDHPRATPQAPDQDVPRASPARAPGSDRPRAAQLGPDYHRPHPAPMAPLGHALARAGTYVPITTTLLPARVSRLLQDCLSRITATPNTRTYPQSRRPNRHSHRLNRHSRASGNPRPPVATGGLQGGYAPASPPLHMVERGPGDGPKAHHTWHYPCGFGPSGGEARSATPPVHPPITAPTAARRSPPTAAGVHPATHGTGSPPHPARAPPSLPSPHAGAGPGVRQPTTHYPPPPLYMVERGPGDRPKAHHTWHYPCGFGPSGGEASRPPLLRMARIASSAEGFSSDETSPGSSAR